MKFSIIVPAYNEYKNLKKISKILIDNNKNLQSLYIIDDSKTKCLDKNFLKKNKKIKYIHRKKKLGRGSAVLYGLKKAKNKNVSIYIEMDADFSHPPKQISSLVNFFIKKELDLLIASRYLRKSKIINWSINRIIFSFLANKLAKFLLKVPVSDYTNGFRIYSFRAADLITKKCGKIGDGFIVLSEILMWIHRMNYKISEKETIFKNRVRGESSVGFNEISKSLVGLLKIFIISKIN
jgi:dolichol-phosphate mannosyltransferase